MITIESNIDAVIGRFERFEAGLPKALAAAMDREYWLPKAKAWAAEVLRVLADSQEEQEIIPRFIDTITVAMFGPQGMRWTMRQIREGLLDVVQAAQTEQVYPLVRFVNFEQAQKAQDLIEQWVREEKQKESYPGGRDYKKTDEEIARAITIILFSGRVEHARAKESLLPHLQQFALDRAQAQLGLSPERAADWLISVLQTWRLKLLSGPLLEKARAEIQKLWGEAGQ